MSTMQTTCPSCHAIFRVRAEQLAAHAGKVRCGKCAYVFNGFETLITPIETVSFMAPYEEDEAEEKAIAVERRPANESVSVYEVRPITISESLTGSFPLQTDEQLARETEEINRVIAASSHLDLTGTAAPHGAKPNIKITPELHAKLNNLQQQLSQQENHHRWHVFGWSMALLVLFLALAAQSIYFLRNTLVAYYPETKTLLTAGCQVLNCKIEMLANISLIKLEGAELQAMPDRPHIVTFSASMRNHAPYRQAYPTLELTLTDITNQALARRHFAPSEYLAPGLKADSGLPLLDEVPIKITLDLDRLDAVGYKSRVLYP